VFTYELEIDKKLQKADNNNEYENATDANDKKATFKLYRENNGKTEYVKLDNNNRVTGWASNENEGSEIGTNSEGKVKFIGLDEGTYKIKEIQAPPGYNKMSDQEIIIDATTVNVQTWAGNASSALTGLTPQKNGAQFNVYEGKATMEIQNNRGSSLPSTGGIGTTIFYVGGGTMAAVAGVYLITRKRMKNSEKQ
jgi:LPXTG-motif cell wall-anchored protein